MIARTIEQTMPVKRLPRLIVINAREPVANATMPMMIAAWVTSSVLISKANFMPPSDRDLSKNEEKLEEEGVEGAHAKGRNPGTVPTAEVTATAPLWFVVRALKPTCGEMSSILLLPVY
jgi:hypothetical protein